MYLIIINIIIFVLLFLFLLLLFFSEKIMLSVGKILWLTSFGVYLFVMFCSLSMI